MKTEENTHTVYPSIEDAIKDMGLSKRVRWKNYLGYLCRYTKKDICPVFVVRDGIPVKISESIDKTKI